MTQSTQTSKFQVNDIVKFAGPRQRRQYKVARVDFWGSNPSYNLVALSGGVRGSRPTGVSETDLVLASAPKTETVDKYGKTASQFAKEAFPVGGYAKADYYYTTCETVVVIDKITKTQIKVKECHGGLVNERGPLNQEYYTVDTSALKVEDKVYTFQARIYNGEWVFWSGDRSLKAFDGEVERMLD